MENKIIIATYIFQIYQRKFIKRLLDDLKTGNELGTKTALELYYLQKNCI